MSVTKWPGIPLFLVTGTQWATLWSPLSRRWSHSSIPPHGHQSSGTCCFLKPNDVSLWVHVAFWHFSFYECKYNTFNRKQCTCKSMMCANLLKSFLWGAIWQNGLRGEMAHGLIIWCVGNKEMSEKLTTSELKKQTCTHGFCLIFFIQGNNRHVYTVWP